MPNICDIKSIFNRIDMYDYVMIQICDYRLKYLKIHKNEKGGMIVDML